MDHRWLASHQIAAAYVCTLCVAWPSGDETMSIWEPVTHIPLTDELAPVAKRGGREKETPNRIGRKQSDEELGNWEGGGRKNTFISSNLKRTSRWPLWAKNVAGWAQSWHEIFRLDRAGRCRTRPPGSRQIGTQVFDLKHCYSVGGKRVSALIGCHWLIRGTYRR